MSLENSKKGFTRANLSRLFLNRRVFILAGVVLGIFCFWGIVFGAYQDVENQWVFNTESQNCGPYDNYSCYQTLSAATQWTAVDTNFMFLIENQSETTITYVKSYLIWEYGSSSYSMNMGEIGIEPRGIWPLTNGYGFLSAANLADAINNYHFNEATERYFGFGKSPAYLPDFHFYGAPKTTDLYPAGEFQHYNFTPDANISDMMFNVYTGGYPESEPPWVVGLVGPTATSTGLVITCDITDPGWQYSLCYLFAFLFSADYGDLNQFSNLKGMMEKKPPMGYFYAAKTALSGIATSSKAFEIGTLGPISTYIFDPLKTGLSVVMWFLFGFWVYNRIRNLEL